MGERLDSKSNRTVCNTDMMWSACQQLMNIQEELLKSVEQAAALEEEFAESYEGEAKPEVLLFLQSLPVHIQKLAAFYYKMVQYVTITRMSFLLNDQTMADRLEG